MWNSVASNGRPHLPYGSHLPNTSYQTAPMETAADYGFPAIAPTFQFLQPEPAPSAARQPVKPPPLLKGWPDLHRSMLHILPLISAFRSLLQPQPKHRPVERPAIGSSQLPADIVRRSPLFPSSAFSLSGEAARELAQLQAQLSQLDPESPRAATLRERIRVLTVC
jgi:hypothetical protein